MNARGTTMQHHAASGTMLTVLTSLLATLTLVSAAITPTQTMAGGARPDRQTSDACSAIAFTQPAGSPFSAGSSPQSVAVGDFNGDGHNDLAVGNFFSANVTILLGNGSGGFTQPPGSPVGTGNQPQSVAVGDFNGDGHNDLAVANFLSTDVTILLGDGAGGFAPPAHGGSPIGVGSAPSSVVVSDFNRDTVDDLAVATFEHEANQSDSVIIFLGVGSGHFVQFKVIAVGDPSSVAVGDFNLDDNPDLAVTNFDSSTTTILLGDGTGGFSQPDAPFGVAAGPRSVAVGDFNLDRLPDLATANTIPGSDLSTVSILLGNGAGSFSQPAGSPIAVGNGANSVVVGDFNRDGKPDVATANGLSTTLTILLGNGVGGFTRPAGSTIDVGTAPYRAGVADFNGDGKPDLATVNWNSNDVTSLLNTCSSDPLTPPAIPVAVDIKPGKRNNPVNNLGPYSKRAIRVAILSTEIFDASTVDPISVRFGRHGAEDIDGHGRLVDVNGDGTPDLVLRFMIRQTGIACGDRSASLTGTTFSGQAIEGADAVRTVGCKADKEKEDRDE
jgi:hypothetical protein